MDVKPFWASKTIWANIVAGVAYVATAFGFDLGLEPDVQVQLVGGIMVIVNILLRFVTTKAVTPA